MNVLNETAEQVLQQLMAEVGPKARVSLERIKAACDRIEAMRGLMNYSRVAAVTTEQFGGPRAQTIQNSPQLKLYIAKRIEEYQGRGRSYTRQGQPRKPAATTGSPYPVEGLDSKTRLYIDFILQDNQRLGAENRHLAQMLERASERQPISLADALGRGPTATIGLDVELPAGGDRLPDGLRDALSLLLGGTIPRFDVQKRGNATRLVCQRDGVEEVLLSPSQWAQAKQWLDGSSGGGET